MQSGNSSNSVKGQIMEIWDSRAAAYDSLYGHGLRTRREHEAWLTLLSKLLPPARPLRVLDIGIGTGFLALLIAELGHSVTGIDFSDGMLTTARAKAKRAERHLDLAIGDAEWLPFAPSSFDAVVNRAVLWTLLQPLRALTEWQRVVRPAGLIASIDGLWIDDQPFLRRVGKYAQKLLSGTQDHGLSYSPELCRNLPFRRLSTLAQAIELFRSAGLSQVTVDRLDWIDVIERDSMTLTERLTYRYHRFLVAGIRDNQP